MQKSAKLNYLNVDDHVVNFNASQRSYLFSSLSFARI